MKELPSKVIIIGAGPSGLFAARKLYEIAEEQQKKIEIVFIEREDVVGGKCHTYSDPDYPDLRTEEGAGAVAPNYGVVIDALVENGVDYETMVPVDKDTLEIQEQYSSLSLSEKMIFAKELIDEMRAFNSDYDVYQDAKQNKKQLPDNLLLPFSEYCTLRGMKYLPVLAKPFVPGFGYGAITHCPAYSVLEYMGKTTFPDLALVEKIVNQPSLLAIHGGFQLLMERVARNFDVRLSAKVTKIDREDKVTVYYQQNDKEYIERGDMLILANSPRNWPSLGMELTETEAKCVKQLEFYRYPVAVYKIKGLPSHQYFFPQALEANGFGHLALITTRDNRKDPEDGRLCSVYVNLPPNHNDFVFDHIMLKSELQTIDGVTDVTVIKEKIWEDYMSTLPWELRLELDREQQQSNNTVYLGSYVLGGFEDVVCVANKATDTMSELYTKTPTYVENCSFKNLKRGIQFFTAQTYPPIDSVTRPMQPSTRCTIL